MDYLLQTDKSWAVIRSKIVILTVAEYAALVAAGTVETDVLYIRTP
jgi:hypothetical protein